jgi:hypothetical protein
MPRWNVKKVLSYQLEGEVFFFQGKDILLASRYALQVVDM